MKVRFVLVGLLVWCCAAADAQRAPKTVLQGKEEILFLDDLANPKRWTQAECTVIASKELKAEGRPTVHVHIPVDHHGGEEKYPIGWPRIYCRLRKPAETNWIAFDRVEFLIYAKMSRPKLPKRPLNFQIRCPDKKRATYRGLAEMKLGKWVRISIPLGKIPHLEDLANIGFNISESDYKDKDLLDFYIGGFRLVRSAECRLTEMTIKTRAMFRDQPELKVGLDVVGPPKHVSRGVPFTIRRGKEILRQEMLPVRRGYQTLAMDIAELKLEPGEYALTAFEHDPDRKTSGTFRVVEGPWKEK